MLQLLCIFVTKTLSPGTFCSWNLLSLEFEEPGTLRVWNFSGFKTLAVFCYLILLISVHFCHWNNWSWNFLVLELVEPGTFWSYNFRPKFFDCKILVVILAVIFYFCALLSENRFFWNFCTSGVFWAWNFRVCNFWPCNF